MTSSRLLRWAIAPLGLVLLGAGPVSLPAQSAAPLLHPPACFVLAYSGDSAADSIFLASRIALAGGYLVGQVYSEGFAADTSRSWHVFQRGGWWAPVEPDSVFLVFMALPPVTPDYPPGTSKAIYQLAIRGDSLVGRAQVMFSPWSHPVRGRWPWVHAVAHRAPCSAPPPHGR